MLSIQVTRRFCRSRGLHRPPAKPFENVKLAALVRAAVTLLCEGTPANESVELSLSHMRNKLPYCCIHSKRDPYTNVVAIINAELYSDETTDSSNKTFQLLSCILYTIPFRLLYLFHLHDSNHHRFSFIYSPPRTASDQLHYKAVECYIQRQFHRFVAVVYCRLQ